MSVIYGGHFDPDVKNWVDTIVNTGSSISNSTIIAAANFVKEIKTANIWNKIYMLDLCCGNNLTGALIRMKVPSGVPPMYNNINFIESDYNERGVNGGIAGNGTNKYLDTWIDPTASGIGASENSFMMFTYARTNNTANDDWFMGMGQSSPPRYTILGYYQGGEKIAIGATIPSFGSGGQGNLSGFIGGGTVGSSAQFYYNNGIQIQPAINQNATFGVSKTIFVHCYNSSNTIGAKNPFGYTNRRRSTTLITQGLTSGEVWSLSNAVNKFETALERNVV